MANQLHATLLDTYVSPPSRQRPNSQVSDQRPLQTIEWHLLSAQKSILSWKLLTSGFTSPLHLTEKRQVMLFSPVLHLKETEAKICEITHSLKENGQWTQLLTNELELIQLGHTSLKTATWLFHISSVFPTGQWTGGLGRELELLFTPFNAKSHSWCTITRKKGFSIYLLEGGNMSQKLCKDRIQKAHLFFCCVSSYFSLEHIPSYVKCKE